jgi:hypothetical protein
MKLKIHSDAYYLSEPKVKSHIGGYFYLGNKTESSAPPLTNGPLFCHTTVLKYVVSSVAEAKFGAVFVNAKEGTVTPQPFLKCATNKMPHNSKLATPPETES